MKTLFQTLSNPRAVKRLDGEIEQTMEVVLIEVEREYSVAKNGDLIGKPTLSAHRVEVTKTSARELIMALAPIAGVKFHKADSSHEEKEPT